MKGKNGTADSTQTIVKWWNVVNVAGKGHGQHLGDFYRAVQDLHSSSLDEFTEVFSNAKLGYGESSNRCLTHDNKKAIVQTLQGLKAVCGNLIDDGNFSYVIIRELMSDSVYRQSTGAHYA